MGNEVIIRVLNGYKLSDERKAKILQKVSEEKFVSEDDKEIRKYINSYLDKLAKKV